MSSTKRLPDGSVITDCFSERDSLKGELRGPGKATQRIHVLVRTPIGVYACLSKACRSSGNNLYLPEPGKRNCETCDAPIYEIAFCRGCGAEHVVKADTYDPGNRFEWRKLLAYDALDEPQEDGTPDTEEERVAGLTESTLEACDGEKVKVWVAQRNDKDKHGCLRCGLKDGAYGALRRLSMPVNEVAAVLASSIYSLLPDGESLTEDKALDLVQGVRAMYAKYVSISRLRPSSPRLKEGIKRLTKSTDLVQVWVEKTPALKKQVGFDAELELANGVENCLSKRGESSTTEFRKILSFSDNRQDAAYFASYVQDVHESVFGAWVANKCLKEDPTQYGTVVRYIQKILEGAFKKYVGSMPGEHPDASQVEVAARRLLLREVLAVDAVDSLRGMGLLRVGFEEGIRGKVHAKVVEILSTNQVDNPDPIAVALVEKTLLSLLDDRCVHDGALPIDEESRVTGYHGTFNAMTRNAPLSGNINKAWFPRGYENNYNRHNRRTEFAVRLLNDRRIVCEVLDVIWSELLEARALRSENEKGPYTLDTSKILLSRREKAFVCAKCSGVQDSPGQCMTWRCDGELAHAEVRANDYWCSVFKQEAVPIMVAHEHTAQLARTTGTSVQERFVGTPEGDRTHTTEGGPVNLLSCSTTFEMGVDVGDVGVVLCRTVPPRPANYVQRAGRAGRRPGIVPAVFTVVRSSDPRDMSFWRDPKRLIQGDVPVPYIAPATLELTRRHLYAALVHEVLLVTKHDRLSLGNKDWYLQYGCALAADDAVFDKFIAGITKCMGSAERSGSDAWKDAAKQCRHSRFARMVETMWDENSRLGALSVALRRCGTPGEDARTNVNSTWHLLSQLEGREVSAQECEQILSDPMVRAWIHFTQDLADACTIKDSKRKEQNQKRLEDRDAITHLSNFGALPKYGFPAEQLDLQITKKKSTTKKSAPAPDVALNRNAATALAEYFPGNQLTVAGLRVRVLGLRRPFAGKSYEKLYGFTCEGCGARKLTASDSTDSACECGDKLKKDHGVYVNPEWGFVGKFDGKAITDYQPRTKETVKTFYEESIPMKLEPVGEGFAEVRVSHRAPVRRVKHTLNKIFLCYKCGHCGDADKFVGSHSRLVLNEYGDEVYSCWNAEHKQNLDDYEPVKLFTSEQVDAVKLELSTPIEHNAGMLLADMLGARVAQVVQTSIEDVDVAVLVKESGGVQQCTEFYICDAVPGGAGALTRFKTYNETKRLIASILRSLQKDLGDAKDGGLQLASECYKRGSTEANKETLERVKDYLNDIAG